MAKAGFDPMFNSMTGKTGDSVYYRRHGRLYARRYVKPRNPGTESQVINRAAFSRAVRQWRELPAETRDWYNYRTANLPMNGMNLFISETLMGTRRFDEPVNSGKNREAAVHSSVPGSCMVRTSRERAAAGDQWDTTRNSA